LIEGRDGPGQKKKEKKNRISLPSSQGLATGEGRGPSKRGGKKKKHVGLAKIGREITKKKKRRFGEEERKRNLVVRTVKEVLCRSLKRKLGKRSVSLQEATESQVEIQTNRLTGSEKGGEVTSRPALAGHRGASRGERREGERVCKKK